MAWNWTSPETDCPERRSSSSSGSSLDKDVGRKRRILTALSEFRYKKLYSIYLPEIADACLRLLLFFSHDLIDFQLYIGTEITCLTKLHRKHLNWIVPMAVPRVLFCWQPFLYLKLQKVSLTYFFLEKF